MHRLLSVAVTLWLTPFAALAAQIHWTPVAAGPPALVGQRAAADPSRDTVAIFGGQDAAGVVQGTTWIWTGAWRSVTSGPSPRRSAAMAYHRGTQAIVLFGGTPDGVQNLGDTWLLQGTVWTQVFPATSPPALRGHAMATTETGDVVLFGGNDGSGAVAGCWEWDGVTWQQITSPQLPPARTRHAMAGTGSGDVLLFGGHAGGVSLNDTWSYAGRAWTQLSPPAVPAARERHAMALDPCRQRVAVYGGESTSGSATAMLADTVEWTGSDWVTRCSPCAPGALLRATLAYDYRASELLLFGGSTGTAVTAAAWHYGPVVPASVSSFGFGCLGAVGTPGLATVGTRALPWLGSTITLQLSRLPATGGGAVFAIGGSSQSWGAMALPLSLAVVGLPGCDLLVRPDLIVPVAPAGGTAVLPLPLPSCGCYLGAALYFQGLSVHGAHRGGVAVSNGLGMVLGGR